MNEKEITFVYIVGGNDDHYHNLETNIKSINRLCDGANFLILDINKKYKAKSPREKVIESQEEIDLSKRKVGFQFWRQKYSAVLEAESKYVVYVDTDTVLVNNRFEELFKQVGNKIGAAKHFYVPTFKDFFQKAVPLESRDKFNEIFESFNISTKSIFYAGGVFLYKNTKQNKLIIKKILDSYDSVYKDSENKYRDYILGITDEVFLSGIAQNKIVNLSGALNHCSMGPEHMQLEIRDEILMGKNTFETKMKDIIFLHCDTFRRDPSENYEEPIKSKVKELFYLK